MASRTGWRATAAAPRRAIGTPCLVMMTWSPWGEAFEPLRDVRSRFASADPGMARAIRKRFGDLHPEESGALFEGLVAQTSRAHRDDNRCGADFYYWTATAAKPIEVDFRLTRDDRFVAVEAESGERFSES